MVIDAHSHLGTNNNQFWPAEKLVKSMEDAGIDYSLVITDRLSEYSTMDSVIGLTNKHPQIKVIGDIKNATYSNKEVDKLCNYLEDRKILGVKFYLGYEDYSANDKKFRPIYEFCQKNNFPVVFHTGVLETKHWGLLKHSHPLNVDEVSNTYPSLKIVMAHMGNPWLMDCGAVVTKNENVYMDTSGFFTEYASIAKSEIKFFLKQMDDLKSFMGGFEKVLFGTDFPLYNQKEYLGAVKQLNLSDKESDLVFWKNAANIYNLDKL